MTKRMLIDANHAEETRVVVLDDRHLVDFDFESSTKRQLKGNIYLAKVTRVEPSLQAAFVDYGGGRHGFLAFSEIHPDYYQIPQADREMLEKMERESAQPADGDGDGETGENEAQVTEDADEETAEVLGEQARRRARLLRSYKIQEVIKRRQILLVQVVKEERGNKGAALTTYLSLAGRYCVLMPNTPRGGGISRKISNAPDRRRLKTIVQDLDVPEGMGLIVRTAGQQRSKSEIKRDYEFLLRQWSEIRDTTLQSIAPTLIYEEGDLIKRAMRDLYTRDIEEVLVEGEDGYRSAKRLMQMMMPSRARHVKPYREELPLFFRHRVEDQLDAMHSPTVQLPSGGSIVIHTTEALTAIDVNSGRSTRERHIDETAVKTNVEAADEISRQLRLRDLAGLVVIDFIDMAEMRHQRQVERRLREALKLDRARIQIGKISMFGLLELSRQRLRPSLQELSSQTCPTCKGLGVVRSTESCALHALRIAHEEGIKGEAASISLALPNDVALYLINQKREAIVRIEARYEMKVVVDIDPEMVPPSIRLDVLEKRERLERPEGEAAAAEEGAAETTEDTATAQATEDDDGSKRRRRRRRRRKRPVETAGDRELDRSDQPSEEEDGAEAAGDLSPAEAAAADASGDSDGKTRGRRRRRTRSGAGSDQGPLAAFEQPQGEQPLDGEAGAPVLEDVSEVGPEVEQPDERDIELEVPLAADSAVEDRAEDTDGPAPEPLPGGEGVEQPAAPETLADAEIDLEAASPGQSGAGVAAGPPELEMSEDAEQEPDAAEPVAVSPIEVAGEPDRLPDTPDLPGAHDRAGSDDVERAPAPHDAGEETPQGNGGYDDQAGVGNHGGNGTFSVAEDDESRHGASDDGTDTKESGPERHDEPPPDERRPARRGWWNRWAR